VHLGIGVDDERSDVFPDVEDDELGVLARRLLLDRVMLVLMIAARPG
jgi:hypothetical protein